MTRIVTMDEREAAALAERRAAIAAALKMLAEEAPSHGGCYRVFGSVARDDIHARSDLDLLAEFPHENAPEAIRAAERICWGLRVPCDIFDRDLCDPKFLERALQHSRRVGEKPSRWALVHIDFESAAKHFRMASAIYDERELGAVFDGYVRANAFMHAIQAGHTSLESGLLRIFKTLGEPAPHDIDDGHDAIVRQAFEPVEGRPSILPPELFRDVNRTRRARNLAAKDYDNFDMDRAAGTAEAADKLAAALPSAIQAFVKRIDPPKRGVVR